MDRNKEYKVALVLYTSGLDYDARIRKEILTIQKLYQNVSFKIFAVEPKNREEHGMTSYGVPYRIPFLKTRDIFMSSSHTLAKAMEFYKVVKRELKDYDILWCADEESFPFIIFTNRIPIIWDLHELPLRFVNTPYMRGLFKIAERKCKVVIHANNSRLAYLSECGMISDINKHHVLHNYPDKNEMDEEFDEAFFHFEQWLSDDKCVYLQGIWGEERADVESIGAVLAVQGLKAVVVGAVRPDRMVLIEQRFGKELLSKRIYFAGMIKQIKTTQYIRKCIMSLVFYKNTQMNNWYCDPNRLYMSINNGIPVVVGCNPPMKMIIDEFGVGVCANTDGSDQSKIVSAIQQVLENVDCFRKRIVAAEGQWEWRSQDVVFKSIMEQINN